MFAVITGITIIHHVMWRDEWEAILISYKSTSFGDLWQQTKDEAHPLLWFLLVYIAKFLGPATVIPKLLNYLSAVGYCSIILFCTPFPRLARYAVVFGYFFLFEYGIISRDYAISTLLIVAVMALWQNRQKHSWLFALLLFLLAQASFYTTMMTAVFVIILLAEPLLLNGKWHLNRKDLQPVAFGIVGVITGYETCARVFFMPFNFSFNTEHFILALDRIYCGYLPIPDFSHNSWNSILPANMYVQALVSLVIITAVIYSLRADKRALLFWITYVTIHELFTYFVIIGYMRHSGFLFIAALVAFWFVYLKNPNPVFKPVQKIIIGGVLAVQVFVGFYFVGVEMHEPFSESAETATWLKNKHLDHLPLYSHYIYSTMAISGYLNKPIADVIDQKPYFAVKWKELSSVFDDKLITDIQSIATLHDSSILLLDYTPQSITQGLAQDSAHIKLLKRFTNSNLYDENFTIYLLKK
jgi:hypothetical protein